MNEADAMSARTLAKAFVRLVTVSVVLVLVVGGAAVALSTVSPSSLGFAFHGQLVDQSASPTLAPGAMTEYTVRYRNTGLAVWQRGGSAQVNLGVAGDSTAFAQTGLAVGWLSPTRIATTSEQMVPPGMIGTFKFTVRAPTAPGAYRVPLRLVVDGLTWLDDQRVVLTVTSDLGFHDQLVDQALHPTLAPGETSAPLTVRFRNTGARTWTRGVAGQQVNLGIVDYDKSMFVLAAGWPSADRVATQTELVVGPGGIATFTFRVKGPAAAGIYPLRLRVVADGVTWLDDEDAVTLITVGATAGPPADKAFVTSSPTFTFGAIADPANTVPGGSVKLTATFTSATASSAVVGVEVYSPGRATLAYQKWFHNESFAAGEQRAYPISWSVPAGAGLGTYSVTLSAYSQDWKALYGLKASAAAFSVNAATVQSTPAPTAVSTAAPSPGSTQIPPPTSPPTVAPTLPPPAPGFTTTSSVAPASVVQGSSLGVTALVTGASASTALVDIEIWAPSGATPAYQVWFDNQTFGAGETRAYPATWQVPGAAALGTYRVAIGVYSPGWATLYSWTNTAATFSVVAPAPSPSPTPVVTASPAATPVPTVTIAPTVAPTATPVATNPPAPTPLPYPADPIGFIGVPAPNASVSGTVLTWGYAIDRNATGTTTGVDRVDLYRDGAPGAGTLLGTAIYGGAYPEVATLYGNARWTNSLWSFYWTVGSLSAGTHTLYVAMHSSVTGATKTMTQIVTVQATATPTPPPSAGRVAALPIAPSTYTIPVGAVSVSDSAGLRAALAGTTPRDIVLAAGVYDNAGAFDDVNGHRLYSATLGGAVLRAGLVLGGNGGPGNGLVRGVTFDVSDPAKTSNNAIVLVWGSGRGSRILDSTFYGHSTVGTAIGVRQPEGLVVQRVKVRDFSYDGILVDANAFGYTVSTPPLLEDLDVANVSFPTPKTSNGTAEACVWIGNTSTVRRVLARNCAWMGVWTGSSDSGSLHEDFDIDGTGVGVYLEHYTTGTTFQRLRIGPNVSTGIMCEWAEPPTSIPASTDNVIQDSTIASTDQGVWLDYGTIRTTVRRVTFSGQTRAGIIDYVGVNNAYYDNDYSGIAPGAVPVSYSHP